MPGSLSGASPESFVGDSVAELQLARRVLGAGEERPVQTVFFGGGTPTLLPAADLVATLSAIDSEFGLAPGAEVTTEANPESVDPDYFEELRAGGFNRISLGMQSAVPHVLKALDRTHTPGRAAQAAIWARAAGFEEVSLDLIYGAPGESAADWQTSLDAALAAEPTHVSAYSLIVEPGTRMARQVARGELVGPDEDTLADRYEMADAALTAAGFRWYEVSNWARNGVPARRSQCRHNLGYWRGADWWGIGPGAHSHVGGIRWWNVKHPRAYSAALAEHRSPVGGQERLTPTDLRLEAIMLGIRLADGLVIEEVGVSSNMVVDLLAQGLVDPSQAEQGSLVLTLRGRLLADFVVWKITENN